MKSLTAALVCSAIQLWDGQVGEERVVPAPVHVLVRGGGRFLLMVTETILWSFHTWPARKKITQIVYLFVGSMFSFRQHKNLKIWKKNFTHGTLIISLNISSLPAC